MLEGVVAALVGVVVGFVLSAVNERWDSRDALRFDIVRIDHLWARSTMVDVGDDTRVERWTWCTPADKSAILFVFPTVHAWNGSRTGDAVRRAELLVTTSTGDRLKPVVARRADGQEFVGANVPAFGLGAWVFWFDLERQPRGPFRQNAPEELFTATYDATLALRLLSGKGKSFELPLKLGAAMPRSPMITFELVDIEPL